MSTGTLSNALKERNNALCELCNDAAATVAYAVSPRNNDDIENEVALCATCLDCLEDKNAARHWQCLAGSIWSTAPSVQALTYRILHLFSEEAWAGEIMQSVALDESVTDWALSAYQTAEVHRDSNGTPLENGDTIVLTQNLNVKGTSFTAPKGTIVRKIRLVPDNTEQVEGKIHEQTIVILTKYTRKS